MDFHSFPQEIAGMDFHSFPQEIAGVDFHPFPQEIVSDRIAHAELALTMKGAGRIKGAKNGASRPKRI